MKPPLISVVILIALTGLSCNNNAPDIADTTYKDTTRAIVTNDTNTNRGMQLFAQKCKICHGPQGDVSYTSAANLQHTLLDSMAIAYTIKNGRHNMPGFLTMPDTDVAQLAMYVKSLRTHFKH